MQIDHIEEDEISDEALEAAGTRTEVAWTFICTGIQCNHVGVSNERPRRV
jgi:hypothetical protein